MRTFFYFYPTYQWIRIWSPRLSFREMYTSSCGNRTCNYTVQCFCFRKGNRIPDVLSFVVENKITPEENKVFITNLYNTYVNGKPKPSRFGFVGFHDNKEIANIQTYLAKDLNLLPRENVKVIWVILFSDENNVLPFEKPEYQKNQFLYGSMIPG